MSRVVTVIIYRYSKIRHRELYYAFHNRNLDYMDSIKLCVNDDCNIYDGAADSHRSSETIQPSTINRAV